MPEQTYRTTYDEETGSLHVYLKEDMIDITRPVNASVYIDYNKKNEKVGIEILLNRTSDDDLNDNNDNNGDLDESMTAKAESFNDAKLDTYD